MGIKFYGEGSDGIQAYTSQDPYEKSTDNRPLKSLADNDLILNTQIISQTPKYPVEDPDGIINTFTFPDNEKATPGSLAVLINGVEYNPLNILLSNDGTQFTIINDDIIPDSQDDFYCIYRINNELDVITEIIPFQITDIYIGSLAHRQLLKSSITFGINNTPMVHDDANGNLILISDSSFVGTIDYVTGNYDFFFNFGESGGLESGDEIVANYQFYRF